LLEVFRQFAFFDAPFLPQSARGRLSRELALAGEEISAEDYASASFSLAAFCGALAFACFFLMSLDYAASSVAALASLVSSICIASFLPSYLKKRRAEAAEAELCSVLRMLAAGLEFMPFEKSLAEASRGGGVLAREFRRALSEADRGASSVPQALAGLAARFDSMAITRACSQLCLVYSGGGGTGGLRKQADELVSARKSLLRRFSSKLSLAGIVFIAASCIVPALFAVYAIIGSSLLSFSFSSEQVLIAYALVFPAADAAILLFVYEKTPRAG
jgi:hypothetical protein